MCREGDGEVRAVEPTKSDAERYGRNDASAGRFAVVHLIERDPREAGVIRAALRWLKRGPHDEEKGDLVNAIARLEASRKKR